MGPMGAILMKMAVLLKENALRPVEHPHPHVFHFSIGEVIIR